MSYVSADGGTGAGGYFLCAITTSAAGAQDGPNLVVYRGTHDFVVLNRFPVNAAT